MAALYSGRHEGAALVIGYAPSVRADVEAARALRPAAALLGVKYACVLYQEIEHVWTQHIEEASDMRERAGRRIFIHSRGRLYQGRRYQKVDESDVDYLWPQLRWTAGSSGFVAALWARHGMGFNEVILCGVPLDHGGYCEEIQRFKKPQGAAGSFVDPRPMERWRNSIREFVGNGRAAGITSMSGWTQSVLGAPG